MLKEISKSNISNITVVCSYKLSEETPNTKTLGMTIVDDAKILTAFQDVAIVLAATYQ